MHKIMSDDSFRYLIKYLLSLFFIIIIFFQPEVEDKQMEDINKKIFLLIYLYVHLFK